MDHIIVEITHGGEIESRHRVDLAVCDPNGRVPIGHGDVQRPVLPRSAAKPLQAVPLVSSGATDALSLGNVELALACASHSGEHDHVSAIEAWLGRLGWTESALECGAQPPIDETARAELIRNNETAGPRHNNCSGKHSGLLSQCRHLGLDSAGYTAPAHPVQRDHVTPALEDLCGIDARALQPAIDGCGIPVWPVPLVALARGWARLPTDPAGQRLLGAMVAHPFFVAGTGRACTRILEAAGGRAVVKTGAEGMYCGVVPEAGLGIALKAEDGGTRAAEATIEWVLAELGVLDPPVPTPMTNWAGVEVGEIRVRPRQAQP